jgi:hypothetical protein
MEALDTRGLRSSGRAVREREVGVVVLAKKDR